MLGFEMYLISKECIKEHIPYFRKVKENDLDLQCNRITYMYMHVE
jgi:hypothetical protein